MRCGGIVLCGGESSRMGRPKALLPFGPETMLQRVVRLLGDVVRPVAVVGAPGQELPALPPDVAAARDEQSGMGPLEGLRVGLKAISRHSEAAFVTSCDAPLLQVAFVRRMIELCGDHEIAAPRVAGREHPLAAVYRVSVLERVEGLLAGNQRSMRALLRAARTRYVGESELAGADAELLSLCNINGPDDYQTALGRAGLA